LEFAFRSLALIATLCPALLLVFLVGNVLQDSLPRLGLDFLLAWPSRKAELAGIWPAAVGSTLLVGLTALLALPVGVAAAVYLEEFGRKGRLANWIEVNIINLAGVPSILYGLLGLAVFVRALGFGRSLLAGACTLALLVLPIVITASREALRTVPDSVREAAWGLGATRVQTIAGVVLPMALPGILTGAILAVARALGETAPLVVIGALAYVTFLPDGLTSPFTALPIQIFHWVSRPQPGFVADAAAGIIVLLIVLLSLNAAAIVLRDRARRRLRAP
jgi:phosphate transport system permease protein